ncbi:hypothetical protein ACHWQZ_G015544 [Mnemiopsis leidyi]
MPKTVNLYFNIAISDVLMGVLTMPWVIYYISIGRPADISGVPNITEDTRTRILNSYSDYRNKTFHRVMCVMSGYAYNVLIRVTSLTVLLLSIDRTHAIYFPLTYGRAFYSSVYKYCIYIIWAFALGIQAVPFLAGIPYVEQYTRELMCSWSIIQLLGLSHDEIQNNKLQIFFPYFILVDIPLLIPTTVSVCLSFAVLFKILYKRYEYITERQSQMVLTSSTVKLEKCSGWMKFRAALMMSTGDNHKVKSLTRASCTMLIIVLTYTVCYSYTWFICVNNTLVLLGVEMNSFSRLFTDPTWAYIGNSFHITVFFQSAVVPFVVYYRVISNFSGGGQDNKSTTAKGRTDFSGNMVNNNKFLASRNGRGVNNEPNQNGRGQKFV